MSRLEHGLFRSAFMLCDRCIINGTCERFTANGDCAHEREAYDRVVDRLIEDYDLDEAGDLILAQRAAMYFIRIARAECYDARISRIDRAAVLGVYIAQLAFIEEGGPEELKAERLCVGTLRRHISHEGFSHFLFYLDLSHQEDAIIKKPRCQPILNQLEILMKQNIPGADIFHALGATHAVEAIHEALVLRISQGIYYEEGKIFAQLFELLHTEGNLPPCDESVCEFQRERLSEPKTQGGYAE